VLVAAQIREHRTTAWAGITVTPSSNRTSWIWAATSTEFFWISLAPGLQADLNAKLNGLVRLQVVAGPDNNR